MLKQIFSLFLALFLACAADAQVRGRRYTNPARGGKKTLRQPSRNTQTVSEGGESASEADVIEAADAPVSTSTPIALPKGAKPYEQKMEHGKINWSNQYIEATGEAVMDLDRFKNGAQARAMATRGAVVVAQRNLLEIVKGVTVTSETTVEDLMTTKDLIVTRIEGVVKGAEQVGEPIEKDGLVRVRLRMPLYAANGLAPAVYDQLPVDAAGMPADSAGELAASNAAGVQGTGASASALGANPNVANLALNLGGKAFDPSLFPVMVDEKGQVLLDMRKLYDPAKGKFPQIIQTTRQILSAAGLKKGTEILDVLDTKDGKIRISDATKSKIPWDKIGRTAKTIGKFLLMLI